MKQLDRRSFLVSAAGIISATALPAAPEPCIARPTVEGNHKLSEFMGIQPLAAHQGMMFYLSAKKNSEMFHMDIQIDKKVVDIPSTIPLYDLSSPNDVEQLQAIAGRILVKHAPLLKCDGADDFLKAQRTIARETRRGIGNVLFGCEEGLKTVRSWLNDEVWETLTTRLKVISIPSGMVQSEPFVMMSYRGSMNFDAGLFFTPFVNMELKAGDTITKIHTVDEIRFATPYFVMHPDFAMYWKRIV